MDDVVKLRRMVEVLANENARLRLALLEAEIVSGIKKASNGMHGDAPPHMTPKAPAQDHWEPSTVPKA